VVFLENIDAGFLENYDAPNKERYKKWSLIAKNSQLTDRLITRYK
jgi:hypothetical protein